MIYYDKIQSGELDIEDTIMYTSNYHELGGGTTSTTYTIGSNIQISFLLEQSIVNSNNTAINILIKNFWG